MMATATTTASSSTSTTARVRGTRRRVSRSTSGSKMYARIAAKRNGARIGDSSQARNPAASAIVIQAQSCAEPLFFLDYYVCEKLDVRVATQVVKGIAAGCELAGCALIGGETAEHPNAFPKDEYDLAGFALGVVEKDRIVDGRSIRPGDVILGLAASGPHSNGYSLIRKILERARPPRGVDLLEPTRIYVKPVLKLLESVPVKGLAHITGGGLIENVPRVLPEKTRAVIKKASWPRPEVFRWLQREGNVAEEEMQRVFNCGIGMVLVATAADAKRAAELLRAAGETVYEIGVIEKAPGAPQAIVV